MRKFLDSLYLASGWLAAISIVAMTILIVSQIVGRLFNVVVPSAIQLSGFLLAASIFLGLAYTMAKGDHVRVTLVLEMVSPRVRLWLEGWSLVVGLAVVIYFAVFSLQITWDSFAFGDKSDGLVSIPLWIPQSTMALGAMSLAVRMVDEFVTLLRTGRPVHLKSGEEQYMEEILTGEMDTERLSRNR